LLGVWTLVGNSGNEQTITLLPQADGSGEDGAFEPSPAVYIKFLGPTTFKDVPAGEVVAALGIPMERGNGPLGPSTMSEGFTS
jgi:hypothetical protein